MKKLFTLAAVAFFGISASYAQDPSTWKNGQDVTNELQWKAVNAADEDPENPVWQGFQYGGSGEWEFRPAGTPSLTVPPTTNADGNACPAENFICWGVYNLPSWDVYQEFEMPAGIYTLKVSGCYREGSTGPTFDLWAAGKSTNNCFLYAKVGDETYQTPMIYMFEGAQQEPFYVADGWTSDCHFNKNGVEIYGPSCHSGADNYIEAGNYDNNAVTFVVPEKTIVRVGINKTVEQNQDQGWWNHWKMEYVMPYNEETSKSFLAYQDLEKNIQKARDFAEKVTLEYNLLGSLMNDEVADLDNGLSATSPLADIQKAAEDLAIASAANEDAYTKAKGLSFMIDVCKGVLLNTNSAFAKADELEAAIKVAEDMIADEEGTTYESIGDFITKAAALNKARVAYVLSQDKAEDGSIDMTHAISTPWFVNQEYTPHLQYVTDDGTPIYQFPDEIEGIYFGEGSPGDECINLENGKWGTEANKPETWTDEITPLLSDKAHWTTDTSVENQWVYEDKWAGWHGGYAGYVQKVKGYAVWYSAWAQGANANGAMKMYQVVTDLPDGYYTLEGRLFCSAGEVTGDGVDLTYATNGNEYLFINDGNNNEIAKVMVTEPRGFWDFYTRDGWITLKTDYVYVSGGKITLGYNHNDMAANAGVILKYYGTEIDYTALVDQKMSDVISGSERLWTADAKEFDAMIAKVVTPVSGSEAYQAAIATLNDANAFKKTALNAINSYNVANDYSTLMNKYEDGDAPQVPILEKAQAAAIEVPDGENASYKDIPAVKELYNAYAEYIAAYDRAYEMNSELVKPTLEEQTTYLNENVATVDKLVEFSRALQTPMNEAIFAEMGADKATETSPVDITSLLQNPTFAEGPKTGWTISKLEETEGDEPDMAINTYGREQAESWNKKPFSISQTLRSLPAGCYEFKARACYRDGGSVDENMVKRLAACEGDYSKLENNNATIFANNCSDYIKSVADCNFTEPTFSKCWMGKPIENAVNAGFMEDWDHTVCVFEGEESVLDADDLVEYLNEVNLDSPAYPFDTKVGDNYYPCSMAGFRYAIANNENVYCNSVRVMVEKGGDLTVGLRKLGRINGDWLIYDDFQLFYLGTETPTSIKDVDNASSAKVIYNVAGQRMNALQKGINIVNGKKVFVK